MSDRVPVYQPKGTRDGSRFLKGRTVYVAMHCGTGEIVGVFTTRTRAKSWLKETIRPYVGIHKTTIVK